jgi:undecaprenyl phosphate N,N'-diacetylbacillosamine 1-phosphate transferase
MRRETQLRLKRLLDIALASCGLLLVSPLLALVALAIKLDSRGSVFFRLPAAGLRGKPFYQIKLRTMVENAREMGDSFETSSTDARITRVGRLLRRWSIDELPQLWNVMRGEMSMVGPRPTFLELAVRYSPEQARRLGMRPGLTGLAQVNGRNALSWPERIQFDVQYIGNYSLGLDLAIIARTLPALLQYEGIYGKDGRVRIPDLG